MSKPVLSPGSAQSDAVQQGFRDFLETPLSTYLEKCLTDDPAQAALGHFRQVAATVPAYGDFLAVHDIDPATIQTSEDFLTLPLLTKPNYIQKYSLSQLCRNGQLSACDMIAVSSGSTGEPTFWPRSLTDELAIATRFEQVFADAFQAQTRRTLAIVCFAMGTWVGGLFTLNCCRHLAAKGYPLTGVAPGNNKDEIFRVLTELGPQFDQVVLLGYPPFLKDVVDSGLTQGVDWARYNIKLVMAGEVFSEEWRTLMLDRLGVDEALCSSASLYGTADAGVLGNETPLSIAIRRFLATHPEAARALFGESRLPTLLQYDPLSRYFETVDDTLLFSGDNGVPLVRYHIADTGGLVSYAEMLVFLADYGFNPLAELPANVPIRSLPFVYVFGRSQFVVSYFGANIYPENISVALEQPGVSAWVTGKFVLEVREDDDRNCLLFITLELAPGVTEAPGMLATLAEAVRTQLRRLNSEFAHYVPAESQRPHVILKPAGDPEDFPVGVKHRYTRPPQKGN